jgi:hypothetical protein
MGEQTARILKADVQNQTRPARYRAINPPQFSGKRRLYSAGAAMNFIVNARLRAKKTPAVIKQQGKLL